MFKITKETAIEIKNLTAAYEGEPVLWNCSADFPKGELTAIIGPNGAGKSTMLKAMLNFLKPLTGEITYYISNRKYENYKKAKNYISYVPQKKSVDWDFPATALDVVLMGRYGKLGWFKRPSKNDKSFARKMLKKVEMEDFENRQISQLSGGQRQRVFLARALAEEAEIYILDEPLAGVDMKTEQVIMELLRDMIEEGNTVLVVHHDLQTVEDYFDHVLFLNQKIIAQGSVKEIFTEENIDKTYKKNSALEKKNEEGDFNVGTYQLPD